MSWIMIIATILPLLLKVLEWLKDVNPAELKPRQRERVGQLLTACQEYTSVCGSKGFAAVALPVESASDE